MQLQVAMVRRAKSFSYIFMWMTLRVVMEPNRAKAFKAMVSKLKTKRVILPDYQRIWRSRTKTALSRSSTHHTISWVKQLLRHNVPLRRFYTMSALCVFRHRVSLATPSRHTYCPPPAGQGRTEPVRGVPRRTVPIHPEASLSRHHSNRQTGGKYHPAHI